MIILNFSHPLTEEQLRQVAELTEPHERLIEVKVQFDIEANFVPQVAELVAGLDLTPQDWQNKPFVVVLPSLNYIAAILLIELERLMGHFPTVLRLRSIRGALITTYEVAEIINLEKVREMLASAADDDDDEYDAYDDDDENDDLPQQVSIAHVSVPVGFMTPSALEERFNVLRGTVNAAARRNPIQRWHVALDGRTRIVDVKHSLLTWGDDWCVHPGKMLAAHLDPPDGVWKLQCLDHASHTWKQNYASKEALLDAMAELAPLKEWSSRPDDIDEVLA